MLIRLERRIGLLACRHRLFLQRAEAEAREIVNVWKPTVLLTVHTPVVAHLVGQRIKRRYPEIRWVSFFSDPWPTGVLPPPYRCSTRVYWIERRCLRRVLEMCDAVAVTSRFARAYLERAAELSIGDRCFTLPHCGGRTAAQRPHDGRGGSSCRQDFSSGQWLFHAGVLSGQRQRPELFKAVRDVAERYPQQFRGLLLAGEGEEGDAFKMANAVGAGPYVKALGPVVQSVVMRLASQAACNLVVEAAMLESPFCPSKVADYAAVGRPILAMTPPTSEIRSLFREYGGGLAVAGDVEEIGRAIEETCVAGKWQCRTPDRLAAYFGEENVVRAYSDLLETLLQRDGNRKDVSPVIDGSRRGRRYPDVRSH